MLIRGLCKRATSTAGEMQAGVVIRKWNRHVRGRRRTRICVDAYRAWEQSRSTDPSRARAQSSKDRGDGMPPRLSPPREQCDPLGIYSEASPTTAECRVSRAVDEFHPKPHDGPDRQAAAAASGERAGAGLRREAERRAEGLARGRHLGGRALAGATAGPAARRAARPTLGPDSGRHEPAAAGGLAGAPRQPAAGARLADRPGGCGPARARRGRRRRRPAPGRRAARGERLLQGRQRRERAGGRRQLRLRQPRGPARLLQIHGRRERQSGELFHRRAGCRGRTILEARGSCRRRWFQGLRRRARPGQGRRWSNQSHGRNRWGWRPKVLASQITNCHYVYYLHLYFDNKWLSLNKRAVSSSTGSAFIWSCHMHTFDKDESSTAEDPRYVV